MTWAHQDLRLRGGEPREEDEEWERRARPVPGKSTLTSRLVPAPAQRRTSAVPAAQLGSAAAELTAATGEAAAQDGVAVADPFGIHLDGADADGAGAAASRGPGGPGGGSDGGGGLAEVMGEMGQLFSFDFSSVRVRSDASAEAIGAVAYAAGDEVVFQPGQLDPGNPAGRELLAHELAHVVQQARGQVTATTEIDGVAVNDDDRLEREADEAAARVMRGELAGLGGGAAHGAQVAQLRVAQRQDRRPGSGGPTAPGSLMQLSIDELIRLYLAAPAEAPITLQVGGVPVEYDAAFLRSDSGRVRMRGALRSRLASLGGNAEELARLRGLLASRASEPAALEVEDMLAQAVARTSALGDRASHSAGALVDAGRELRGRTWGARSGVAETTDGRPGRVMDGRVHAAMDVTGRARTGVYAPCAGRVLSVRVSETYGNVVRILHESPPPTEAAGDGPLTTNYAHLDEALVASGDAVAAGQAIGMMGMTGLAPGVHLHWSVQRVPEGGPGGFSSDYEERTDIQVHPDAWLAELGTSVAVSSTPRATRRRGRGGRRERPASRRMRGATSRAAAATSLPRQRRVAQRWGGRDSDTMRAHHDRGELHRRHDELGERDLSDGAVVHGDADRRAPLPLPELEQQLGQQLEQRRASTGSVVPAEYVQRIVRERASFADVQARWTEAITSAGTDSWEQQMSALERAAPELLHLIQQHFIHDRGGSGLDVLGEAGAGYRSGWGRDDYPRGVRGAGEPRARAMSDDLSAVVPERRPNGGDDVVIGEREFDGDARTRAYLEAHEVVVPAFTAPPAGSTTVPSQPGNRKMLDLALEPFLRMRAAALADGVALIVSAGYRSRETAAANAAAAANPDAVADFSSHTLGLAVDLRMSTDAQTFSPEIDTHDMQLVTDERTSPVHRWMIVRAAEFGWYPYHNEPWHWEYNPPGLREHLRALIRGGGGSGAAAR